MLTAEANFKMLKLICSAVFQDRVSISCKGGNIVFKILVTAIRAVVLQLSSKCPRNSRAQFYRSSAKCDSVSDSAVMGRLSGPAHHVAKSSRHLRSLELMITLVTQLR